MPHKKAKRSIRAQDKSQKGSDWAPGNQSLANEPIPKSAARILDSQKIRDEYREKKRKFVLDMEIQTQTKKRKKTDDDKGLKILPGESIQHFNRRVEDDLRPLVKSAIEVGRSITRKALRDEKDRKKGKPKATKNPLEKEPTKTSQFKIAMKHDGRAKEFQTSRTSAPKRLNDIAQAPPELNIPTRGAANPGPSKVNLVASIAQKAMMEQQRLGAIARYREMKAKRKQLSD